MNITESVREHLPKMHHKHNREFMYGVESHLEKQQLQEFFQLAADFDIPPQTLSRGYFSLAYRLMSHLNEEGAQAYSVQKEEELYNTIKKFTLNDFRPLIKRAEMHASDKDYCDSLLVDVYTYSQLECLAQQIDPHLHASEVIPHAFSIGHESTKLLLQEGSYIHIDRPGKDPVIIDSLPFLEF